MPTAPPREYPAISVVIPMYNTEKYIGFCLESLLAQTFQNFEVIVVDVCSTDNSCAVVESCIPKFGGRIKLSRLEKNTGGPGIPSNKGISLSRGKYVYVMDNDDLLTNYALEIFYKFAEDYNADVVSTDRMFDFIINTEKNFPDNSDVVIKSQNSPIDKPTLVTNNLEERINQYFKDEFGRPAWKRLIKRDLLMENDITFPNLKSSADMVFTLKLIFFSKRFLRIPQPLYIHRKNMNSIVQSKRTPKNQLKFWTDVNISGLKAIDEFLSTQKFILDNPNYRWVILDFFNSIHFNFIISSISALTQPETFEILKRLFTEKFGENGNLIEYLCNSSNFLRLRLMAASQYIAQLEGQIKELNAK